MADEDIFRAEARKGFFIKSTFDTLAQRLPRSMMTFKKDGIHLREYDMGKNVLFALHFPRENFINYRCQQEFSTSIAIVCVQKLLKNVKKKDSVTIRVKADSPRVLNFEIKSEAARSAARVEYVDVDVSLEDPIPERADPDGGYKYPMSIDSGEFQKIKKFISVGVKVIKVRMQGNNFISFLGGSEKVFSNRLEYGSIIDNPEDVESDDDDFNPEGQNIPGYYENEFNMIVFSILLKMAGLGNPLLFYRPKYHQYPLKVETRAGDKGTFQVYIKDKAQLEREAKVRAKPDVQTKKR